MFWFPENSPKRGTVSDFHEWVWAKHDENMQARLFYRTHPELALLNASQVKMIKLKMAHSKMQHNKISYCRPIVEKIKEESNESSEWVVEYADPHENEPEKIFNSPRLLVDGAPIKGCPDIVFKNIGTGKILIVETKITWVPISRIEKEGYPNVRAQLWCYSWMAPWANIPDRNVLLCATFWDPELKGYLKTKTWKRSDYELNSECEKWFLEYGGILNKKA